MKRLLVFTIMLIVCIGTAMALSPVPTHDSFGGQIIFKNASSYNLYWEIDLIDNPRGGFYFDRLCLEKTDAVKHSHMFYVPIGESDNFDTNTVDPNNCFKVIRIYDMDTGELLKEFYRRDYLFVLTSGTIEEGSAVFQVEITDLLLTRVE